MTDEQAIKKIVGEITKYTLPVNAAPEVMDALAVKILTAIKAAGYQHFSEKFVEGYVEGYFSVTAAQRA